MMGDEPRATPPVLRISDLHVAFGGVVALQDLSFDLEQGVICGLIGPNGAGKTTLFNVLSRLYQPTGGSVRFQGRSLLEVPAHQIAELGIGRTFQNLALFPALTVAENVAVGAHSRFTSGFARCMLRFGRSRSEDHIAAGDALDHLRLVGLEHVAHRPVEGLPLGTLKRVELARALAAEPRLLLLDEPASGLTHSEVDELAALVREVHERVGVTVLLVEHHMGMVMGLCDKVVAMDFGRKLAEGSPSQVRSDPAVVEAYLGKAK